MRDHVIVIDTITELKFSMNFNTFNKLTLMSWNFRGIMSGVAYLVECLNKYSVDICALQEHWLRGHCAHMLDSIDPFYQSVNTKCVDDNNPTLIKTRMEGGVTFIVKSSILKYVECIELDENRITGIEIPTLNSERIFCFCVYLPATSKSFEYFRTYVERLYDIYSVYSEMRTVYILCDLNVKVNGPRLTSIVTDKRFELFEHCLNEFNLVSLHLQPFGVDSTYTFQSYEDGPTTSIDHILLSNDYICQVNSGRVIDDHSFNVFDHHPIIVEVKIDQNMDVESETIPISDKVAWGKARQQNKLTDYSYAVSQFLWDIEVPNVRCNNQDI